MTAPEADLRTDLPQYAIYRKGVREKNVTDIKDLWRKDSVAFLIGSPIAGALVDIGVDPQPQPASGSVSGSKPNGPSFNFLAVQLWSGLLMSLGTGALMVLWALLLKKARGGGGWRGVFI